MTPVRDLLYDFSGFVLKVYIIDISITCLHTGTDAVLVGGGDEEYCVEVMAEWGICKGGM